MRLPHSPKVYVWLRAFMLAALALLCLPAAAENRLAQAQQRQQLLVGVARVEPAYVAGAKFRTPEGIEQMLAQDLAQRLQIRLTTRLIDPAQRNSHPATDFQLVALADNDPLYRTATVIPTGYSSGPMAIMRTDTAIKSWPQLKGRTVCVLDGGPYAGTLTAQYGAIEQRYKAPADSLLALRTGACDAAVHDSAMLEELIKLPEWKKFSARLPARSHRALVLIAGSSDTATAHFLQQAVADWRARHSVQQFLTKSVRNIAFEVYLDQNVPDCH
jgi:polar amino acid transport system substrate-binding protein